jgi:hypothetical protein
MSPIGVMPSQTAHDEIATCRHVAFNYQSA